MRSGQAAKFNVHRNGNNIRYMLEILDSQDKNILLKNNCAVFIIPPGLETQFSAY